MKEEYSLIVFKWEHGVYGLKKMVELVREGVITPEQFFDITRYNYRGVVQYENW